jgi:hypothetical protein
LQENTSLETLRSFISGTRKLSSHRISFCQTPKTNKSRNMVRSNLGIFSYFRTVTFLQNKEDSRKIWAKRSHEVRKRPGGAAQTSGRATCTRSRLGLPFRPVFDSNPSFLSKTRQYIPPSTDLISHRVFFERTLFSTLSFRVVSTKNPSYVFGGLLRALFHGKEEKEEGAL